MDAWTEADVAELLLLLSGVYAGVSVLIFMGFVVLGAWATGCIVRRWNWDKGGGM